MPLPMLHPPTPLHTIKDIIVHTCRWISELPTYAVVGIWHVLYMVLVKARLIQSDKLLFEDGAIRQIRIWLVPEPVPPSTHRFKYSLVYVVNGVRVVGFDNERGKGDHRHLHGDETPYEFGGIVKLLADFRALIEQEQGS